MPPPSPCYAALLRHLHIGGRWQTTPRLLLPPSSKAAESITRLLFRYLRSEMGGCRLTATAQTHLPWEFLALLLFKMHL